MWKSRGQFTERVTSAGPPHPRILASPFPDDRRLSRPLLVPPGGRSTKQPKTKQRRKIKVASALQDMMSARATVERDLVVAATAGGALGVGVRIGIGSDRATLGRPGGGPTASAPASRRRSAKGETVVVIGSAPFSLPLVLGVLAVTTLLSSFSRGGRVFAAEATAAASAALAAPDSTWTFLPAEPGCTNRASAAARSCNTPRGALNTCLKHNNSQTNVSQCERCVATATDGASSEAKLCNDIHNATCVALDGCQGECGTCRREFLALATCVTFCPFFCLPDRPDNAPTLPPRNASTCPEAYAALDGCVGDPVGRGYRCEQCVTGYWSILSIYSSSDTTTNASVRCPILHNTTCRGLRQCRDVCNGCAAELRQAVSCATGCSPFGPCASVPPPALTASPSASPTFKPSRLAPSNRTAPPTLHGGSSSSSSTGADRSAAAGGSLTGVARAGGRGGSRLRVMCTAAGHVVGIALGAWIGLW